METVRIVKVNVTERCFFRCRMCYAWKNKRESEIDLQKFRLFFEGIKRIKGNGTSVNFTGGEPLLEPKIFELISMASDAGVYTHLNTNGWMIDEKTAKMLASSHLTDISISLDGSSPKTHDYIRGRLGSFGRVFLAIENISRHSPATKIHLITTISNDNLEDIPIIIALAEKQKDIRSIVLNAVTPTLFSLITQEDFYKSDLWPKDKDAIRRLYSSLTMLKADGKKIANSAESLKMQCNYFIEPEKRQDLSCMIGNDMHINNAGQLSHCHVRQDVIGHIDEDISKVWRSDESIASKQRILRCKENCHELLNCGVFK